MGTYIRLERSEAQGGDWEHDTVELGPFEYVQITYEGLYCGDLGPKYYIDGATGMWFPEKRTKIGDSVWESCGPDTSHPGYTDICIYDRGEVEDYG